MSERAKQAEQRGRWSGGGEGDEKGEEDGGRKHRREVEGERGNTPYGDLAISRMAVTMFFGCTGDSSTLLAR